MKELFLISAESTKDSLVLRTEDDEQYFLVVTDDLRTALVSESTPSTDSADTNQETADATSSSISYLAPLHLAASAHAGTDKEADSDANSAKDDTDTTTQSDSKKSTTSSTITAVYSSSMNRTATARDTKLSKLDPRLSAPLKMTPREIQSRIRGGASVAEIAAANDVPESRIESYAHPVLLERSQKAEMAKRAHPVRDDGPTRLTLWEILDTVFTARGLDVRNSTWDSYRDTTGQWVVTVSWTSGAVEHLAEWSYHQQGMTSATAVARNGLAAAQTPAAPTAADAAPATDASKPDAPLATGATDAATPATDAKPATGATDAAAPAADAAAAQPDIAKPADQDAAADSASAAGAAGQDAAAGNAEAGAAGNSTLKPTTLNSQ